MAAKKKGKKSKKSMLCRLVSTGSTGFFYVRKKNSKSLYSLDCKKYDPVLRKHVLFKEKKMSS
ncbi:50S ribosomal protein L33 [Candidatus Fokinia solitaria]|uniref:Large ribosomal subunit protein bL33 n=1 Tax=Candidatus Fokinia solitaria TaxID=1802984 RepID=A0A2U8BS11_9RICK|nr:50S ribosomal protein L33 [Candidatus Fokinia solitaria]AWD33093.1 50S ribosomal protein L33 [Candidatus Fokinia solitaria]